MRGLLSRSRYFYISSISYQFRINSSQYCDTPSAPIVPVYPNYSLSAFLFVLPTIGAKFAIPNGREKIPIGFHILFLIKFLRRALCLARLSTFLFSTFFFSHTLFGNLPRIRTPRLLHMRSRNNQRRERKSRVSSGGLSIIKEVRGASTIFTPLVNYDVSDNVDIVNIVN